MALPSPEQAKSWFNTLYLAVEKATPITLLFLLLVGIGFFWYLLGIFGTAQSRIERLYTALIAAKDAQVAQADAFRDELRLLLRDCPRPSGPPAERD